MTGLTLAAVPDLPERRSHVPQAEYAAWVRATFVGARGTVSSRLFFYKRFVQHWPDLEDWFAAPLLDRLDLHADAPPGSGKHLGISHEAGSYLAYLSLVHRIPMDADWVLARNFDSLFNPRVAPSLGMDLTLVDALDERQQQLGYRSGRSLLAWGIARLASGRAIRTSPPSPTTTSPLSARRSGTGAQCRKRGPSEPPMSTAIAAIPTPPRSRPSSRRHA